MTIRLVTGVPGSGKTLFTVAEIISKLLGTEIEVDGVKHKRRMMIGGIRDLLVEHEPIDVGRWDAEQAALPYSDAPKRMPGDPPITDVAHEGLNWWLWCMPGDVIVLDECQNLFRPQAAGRKIPLFIAKLETHRHYGVDFVIITQHPQLLHTNVRNLVGHHNHVRRLFGGGGTVVYEWDHCTNPDRTKNATTKFWRHSKKTFSLYKSAEVHTKTKHAIPWPVYLLGVALLSLPITGYHLKTRAEERFSPKPKVVALKPSSAVPVGQPGSAPLGQAGAPGIAAAAVAVVMPKPAFAGCIHMASRCECIDLEGRSVEVDLKQCHQDATRGGVGVPYAMQAGRGATGTDSASQGVLDRATEAQPSSSGVLGFNAGEMRSSLPSSPGQATP